MMREQSRFTATVLGAVAGLALALGEVGSTLHYLQTIPAGFSGLPLPANLDWIFDWNRRERMLAGLSGLLDLVARAALLGLALIIFRTLNPDFRLTAPLPPDAESGAVLRQPIDRRRLRQVAAALLISLWLLGYFGAWLPWGRRQAWGLLLAGPTGLERLWTAAAAQASVLGFVLLLGGLWLVWGEAGFLRPAGGVRRGERPDAGTPGTRSGAGSRSLRALAAAALAGVALTPFALPLAGWAQTIATQVLQGIGGAARDAWLAYLGGVLVVYPLALGSAGWTAVSLARWTHFPWERRELAAGGAVAAAAWLGVAGLMSLAGGGRFDYGVPLARAAGVSTGPAGVVTTLTLLPGPRPVIGVTSTVSGQGLTATDASARQVWAYLQWRRFRTVHLFPALQHVSQCEALSWDSDRYLETTLRSLTRNPYPGFCALLIEKLAHCAATPKARAVLARLQDPRWFHLPLGGRWELRALRRRLEMAGGEIYGRLLTNGRPAGGLRVGVVDEALWRQFRGSPTPLSHRLVETGSTVGADGTFRLRQIPPGRYVLLVMTATAGAPPRPDTIRVQGSPGPIPLAPGPTRVNAGTIRVFMAMPPRDEARPARRA